MTTTIRDETEENRMNVLKKFVIVLGGLLALAVCGTSVGGTSSDDAAIRAAGAARDAAYKVLDVDALVPLYADNAVLMPQSEHSVKGRAAIRKFLVGYVAKLKAGGYTPVVASPVEVSVAGNLGIRSGTYSITDKSGAAVDTGKWLEEWRKTGGKWQLVKDISNSDMLPLFPPEDQFPPDPIAAPGGTH